MAEHFCKEHQTVWFKKGKMPNYAHPLLDENGDQKIGDDGKNLWCNEPKQEKAETPRNTETPERQQSIETQNAFTGVVSLLVSGIIKKDDPLAQATYNYASSKLSKWYSQGKPEVEEAQAEPIEMVAPEQRKQIVTLAKEKGYSNELAISIMTRLYGVSASKALTKDQADNFIKVMEAGKYLEKPF